MKIRITYDHQDEIPQEFRPLFTEVDGKWQLTEIEGVATSEDVAKLKTSLTAERSAHSETKRKLAGYTALNLEPDAITDLAAERDDLKARIDAGASDKFDQGKFDQAVAARLKVDMAPLQRENERLTAKLNDATGAIEGLNRTIQQAKVSDALTAAARELNVVPEAHEDLVAIAAPLFAVAEDGSVRTVETAQTTPGLDPRAWLESQKERRPHFWPRSQGAGATGGTGGGIKPSENPWHPEHWNMTNQAQMVRADPARAKRFAESVGSFVGSAKPPAKN